MRQKRIQILAKAGGSFTKFLVDEDGCIEPNDECSDLEGDSDLEGSDGWVTYQHLDAWTFNQALIKTLRDRYWLGLT